MSAYLVFMGIMGALDLVWLSVMTPAFYRKRLAGITDTIKFIPAILFYVLFSIAAVIFVVTPAAIMNLNVYLTFAYGAFFGLVAYGTYDLTNQATISNWPILVTIVDMLWGAFVTGISSVLTIYIFKTFFL
ncbi:MAG TPA: DUF2177 domain-containing protein [Fusobacteria bacterium]|nr:DUF2177 domain-containing protein [Fusobacteriota bacterium]|tara:strand:+ start:8472 stop:8864 length:393 start_codon:yes stop_codon:yes gene_type:complete